MPMPYVLLLEHLLGLPDGGIVRAIIRGHAIDERAPRRDVDRERVVGQRHDAEKRGRIDLLEEIRGIALRERSANVPGLIPECERDRSTAPQGSDADVESERD